MATENDILALHNVLPNRQETSVLFVGAEGTSKHDLSLAMLKLPFQFSLQIRTANSLPLPQENAATRPRIDYICFLINMTDRDSIQVVEKSLSMIDVKYFLGRACLIVTGAHSSKRMTDVEQVTALADSFHLPLVFGEIRVEKDRDQLARRLFKMVEIAAGLKRHVFPSLIESTKFVSDLTLLQVVGLAKENAILKLEWLWTSSLWDARHQTYMLLFRGCGKRVLLLQTVVTAMTSSCTFLIQQAILLSKGKIHFIDSLVVLDLICLVTMNEQSNLFWGGW